MDASYVPGFVRPPQAEAAIEAEALLALASEKSDKSSKPQHPHLEQGQEPGGRKGRRLEHQRVLLRVANRGSQHVAGMRLTCTPSWRRHRAQKGEGSQAVLGVDEVSWERHQVAVYERKERT